MTHLICDVCLLMRTPTRHTLDAPESFQSHDDVEARWPELLAFWRSQGWEHCRLTCRHNTAGLIETDGWVAPKCREHWLVAGIEPTMSLSERAALAEEIRLAMPSYNVVRGSVHVAESIQCDGTPSVHLGYDYQYTDAFGTHRGGRGTPLTCRADWERTRVHLPIKTARTQRGDAVGQLALEMPL